MSAHTKGPNPPAFWERLLRVVLAGGSVTRSILGDLREEFAERVETDPAAARRWYRRAAAGIAMRAMTDRVLMRPSAGARYAPGLARAGGFQAVADVLTSALRSVLRAPRFAFAVALTLALGLGANVTIFGLVDRLMLSPPDGVREPDQVRRFFIERPAFFNQPFREHELAAVPWLTYPDYLEFTKLGTYAEVGGYSGSSEDTFGHGENATRIRTALATPSFFRVLGVSPLLGRLFTDADAEPGAEPTAVLTEPFWRRQFGGDPSALGATLDIGDGRYTVVGVTPAGFTGAEVSPVDAFLELEARSALVFGTDEWRTSRNWWWLYAVGRLAPGVAPEAADEAATAAFRRSREDGAPDSRMLSSSLVPADDPQAPVEIRLTRWLAGVSLLVLLIACANVANLMLVRTTRRRQELAVQRALGLGRGRLVAQVLVESLVLAAVGGAAALVAAQWGGGALRAGLFPDVQFSPVWSSWRIPGFTAAAVIAATCLAGLAPALRAGRGDVLGPLKDGARGTTSDRKFTRSALIAVQAGLTIVLLVGAGLFVRSLRNALGVDLGFDADVLYTASPELEGDISREERIELYYREAERLRSLPEVASVSFNVTGPHQGSITARLAAEGHDSIPHSGGRGPFAYPVGPDYFETLGIALARGRTFTDEDHTAGADRVAVINRTMERALWPDGDAIGRCLSVREGPCNRIVGVVGDISQAALVEDPAMMYWLPFRAEPVGQRPNAFVVRATAARRDPSAAVRSILAHGPTAVRFVDVRSYRDILEPELRSWRLGATVFSAFGVLALLVAAVGLYSMLAFQVAQRRHELGVRSALGAPAGGLIRVVVVQTMLAVAVGGVIGVGVALGGTRGLQDLLFGVTAADPTTYVAALAVLGTLALVAALMPAWRAMRTDPLVALRAE